MAKEKSFFFVEIEFANCKIKQKKKNFDNNLQ